MTFACPLTSTVLSHPCKVYTCPYNAPSFDHSCGHATMTSVHSVESRMRLARRAIDAASKSAANMLATMMRDLVQATESVVLCDTCMYCGFPANAGEPMTPAKDTPKPNLLCDNAERCDERKELVTRTVEEVNGELAPSTIWQAIVSGKHSFLSHSCVNSLVRHTTNIGQSTQHKDGQCATIPKPSKQSIPRAASS